MIGKLAHSSTVYTFPGKACLDDFSEMFTNENDFQLSPYLIFEKTLQQQHQ